MTGGAVELIGITPFDEKCCQPQVPWVEVCETDQLVLHCNDPSIDEIIEVMVKVKVKNFKIVSTLVGKRLVIIAVKQLAVTFKGKAPFDTRHTIKSDIPVCLVVALGDYRQRVKHVEVIVEDINVALVTSRCIAISTLLLAMPAKRNTEINDALCHDGNELRCDIQVRCSAEDGKVRTGIIGEQPK